MSEENDDNNIYACIVHQTVPALDVFLTKEKNGSLAVKYGLCFGCIRALAKRPEYAKTIDRKICEQLNKKKPKESQEGKICLK